MKRYGIKEALKEIANGAEIVYYEFFTLHTGYKLIKDGEITGYLTANTAEKIIKLYDFLVIVIIVIPDIRFNSPQDELKQFLGKKPVRRVSEN